MSNKHEQELYNFLIQYNAFIGNTKQVIFYQAYIYQRHIGFKKK